MKTKLSKLDKIVALVKKYPGLDAISLKAKGWTPQRHGSFKDAEKSGKLVYENGGWYTAASKIDWDAIEEKVRGPIRQTWNYIGCDAEGMCDGDNEGAIEMCIDANRLTQCSMDGDAKSKQAAAAAEKLITDTLKVCEYDELLTQLSARIQLV